MIGTPTTIMNILLVQNFIKYFMKSNNWFITKSTNNYPIKNDQCITSAFIAF